MQSLIESIARNLGQSATCSAIAQDAYGAGEAPKRRSAMQGLRSASSF